MAKKISLTIDGKPVKVAEGTNLIDAAATVGIHIPNLCYLKGMRGIGACRMCLIEIEGMKAPVIGCTTKAKEGMVVHTRTEKVEEVRKFVIDLILSMHPLDCMTCTKAGVCTLQQYAYDYEIKESNFTRKKFGYPIDEANPFIKKDPDYCILCGRCVRVCKEQGTNVLEFMGRGVGSKVTTAKDNPLHESDCTFCGSCIDVCPVNAILEADRWRKGREWDYEKNATVCLLCGNACDIIVSSRDGVPVKVNSGGEEGSVEKYICATGRFGFESVTSDSRITNPMIKENGNLREATWKEALQLIAERYKKAGANSGIVTTASILNQDAFVISKFASEVAKTGNVDTTVSLYSDADSLKHSDQVDIESCDTIVLAGLNASQWDRVLPALDATIRKSVARGTQLININNYPPDPETGRWGFGPISAVNFEDDEATSLAMIARGLMEKGLKADDALQAAVADMEINDDIEKAAEILIKSSKPVIFCHPSLFRASKNLTLLLKNLKVVAVPFEANAKGVVSMGLVTDGKTYSDMIKGGLDLLHVVGDVPADGKPDVGFLVVQSSYMSNLSKEADVVLPAATYLESRGTVITFNGNIKELKRVLDPAGESKQHKDIFIELSKVMDNPIKESAAEIKAAFEVGSKPVFSPFEKQSFDADPAAVTEALCECVVSNSKLLWFREAREEAAVES
jgi:NADH dehydrogenase/NADH:ubiquinone oxidoreductase subunit G